MVWKDTTLYDGWKAVSSPIASVASAAAQMRLMEHSMDFSLAWKKREINFQLIEQEVTKYYQLLCDTEDLSNGPVRQTSAGNRTLECISTQINWEENWALKNWAEERE